jgi:hypothetical protein
MFALTRLFLVTLWGLFLAMSTLSCQAVESFNVTRELRRAHLGIAITPRNFPAHTITDIEEAFSMARELCDHAVFIYQWGELNLEVTKLMVEKARSVGLVPILGLSPTTLGEGRKELDLPARVRRRAGPYVSFANPAIRDAFKRAARDLARLKPPYLCLATEINFLALQRLDEYVHFASLYKQAYREVKRVSLDTRVFVSFQWEWTRIHDAREPHRIKEHSKVIDIFRPELDVVGLTTYPSAFHGSPADLPLDYYSWMYHHIKATDEVLLMEVGWPTSGSGTEQEQEAFIRRLPELLSRLNVTVIAWALLHDVDLADFDANLNTVGLVTNEGRRKAGYEAFKTLRGTLP